MQPEIRSAAGDGVQPISNKDKPTNSLIQPFSLGLSKHRLDGERLHAFKITESRVENLNTALVAGGT